MRQVRLQMQMTLDGFVAGPDGQLDWMSQEMDPKQLEVLTELTNSMDTILMGRKMAGGFTNYWESVVDNQPHSPEYPYAKIFVDTPKIVFSKSAETIPGRNVIVENGDLSTKVSELKKQEGKDIIVYGGAGFVGELIRAGLIDELNLFVNPVAIGNGLRIFNDKTNLKLTQSIACANGLVINRYTLK